MRKPVIGLMLGDATGIGPEICAKLLASGRADEVARVVVIGDARVLELGIRDAGVRLSYRTYPDIDEVRWPAESVALIDLGNIDPARLRRGEASAESGRLTGETLKLMIDLALRRKIDGICFAPLNKGAMHQGGWKFLDEHQMFAKLTAHDGFFGEMNVIREFSTFRVTSHVALREAVNLVTPERISAAIQLAHDTLRAAGHASPRIGVAALNPHSGENGLFGDEEIRIIQTWTPDAGWSRQTESIRSTQTFDYGFGNPDSLVMKVFLPLVAVGLSMTVTPDSIDKLTVKADSVKIFSDQRNPSFVRIHAVYPPFAKLIIIKHNFHNSLGLLFLRNC